MPILPDITEHLHLKEGFCYPDWNAIAEVIEKTLPESEWFSAWESVTGRWLRRMRDQLEGEYQVYETPNFLILSAAPIRIIRDAYKSYEEALTRILSNLDGVASDARYGKHVVLMFSNLDEYYGYISHFYPEGEHPMSGGLCLRDYGCVHYAFPTTDYATYRSVLVHELTHGCLGHLPIPTWLNEALAMRMEQLICGSARIHLDRESHAKHTRHWNKETIQQFWSGESWNIPGDSFELSYSLAQILWQKIETDLGTPRAEILQFASSATYEDAGEAACRSILHLSLGDLVADFLGEGEWAPDPRKWKYPDTEPKPATDSFLPASKSST